MKFQFDSDVAKIVGTNAAVLFEHISNWVYSNSKHDKNCFEDEYWTYNSASAYAEIFEYMSIQTVKREFKKLIDTGLIKAGSFNKQSWDRTSWYTLTEKGWELFESINRRTNQNRTLHGSKSNYGRFEIEPTIPINITNNNNNTICSEQSSSHEILLKDGSKYNVPLEDIEKYKAAYPDKDIENELLRMSIWCESNPSKLKTRKGIKKFINSWLSRKAIASKESYPSTNSSPAEQPDYSDWVR